ncbi:MAG: potassium-transporting ATPase subunit B, partial [Phaeodactylibacter sp.]|nr:potassium-transporting ATPase subunit B [Phaeodactylibacter sp.]
MKPEINRSIFSGAILRQSLSASFSKLDPRSMIKNPVMFTVEIGTVVMLAVTLLSLLPGREALGDAVYNAAVTLILFLTLLFANFAEALAEARGKAQANALRKTRTDTPAKRLMADERIEEINASALRKNDLFLAGEGDIIPADGEIAEGLASIDESAITGESAPVFREAETDRNSVIGGTKVLAGRIKVMVTS